MWDECKVERMSVRMSMKMNVRGFMMTVRMRVRG